MIAKGKKLYAFQPLEISIKIETQEEYDVFYDFMNLSAGEKAKIINKFSSDDKRTYNEKQCRVLDSVFFAIKNNGHPTESNIF